MVLHRLPEDEVPYAPLFQARHSDVKFRANCAVRSLTTKCCEDSRLQVGCIPFVMDSAKISLMEDVPTSAGASASPERLGFGIPSRCPVFDFGDQLV
jgi:hypothetical protein